MSLLAAAAHAPSLAWIIATIAIAAAGGLPPVTPPFALTVFAVGMIAAWLNGKIGARRAGVPFTAADMIVAPAYWSLLTLALGHAVWRLAAEPFAWDKTRHRRDPALTIAALAEVEAGREAA
jgi:hypothetical protein